MKFFMVFVVAFCFVLAQSSASPAAVADVDDSLYVDGLEALRELEPELHGRYKRATCDLLSYTGVAHSACAAHCILLGNRGGYCNSHAVCVCRN